MKLLLHYGANINGSTSANDPNPLTAAIMSMRSRATGFLLDKGADINLKGRGMYALDAAIFSENLELADQLLRLGAKFSHLALLAATYLPTPKSNHWVKTLLDCGADPNAEGTKQDIFFTNLWRGQRRRRCHPTNDPKFEFLGVGPWDTIPLARAIVQNSENVIETLLAAGADPNADCRGISCLQCAAERGYERALRLLLQHGASVNPICFDPWAGAMGPLSGALLKGHDAIVKILLENGAAVNGSGKNYEPPLEIAVRIGSVEFVKLLISNGADVCAASAQGGTALRTALVHSQKEVATILLESGADLYEETESTIHWEVGFPSNFRPKSPLEIAVRTNKIDFVQLLIDKGLDINYSSKACSLALKAAVDCAGLDMLTFLIQQGADCCKNGSQAFEIDPEQWAYYQYQDINSEFETEQDFSLDLSIDIMDPHTEALEKTKLLMDHGANIRNFTGPKDRGPLKMAVKSRNWRLVDFLLDSGCDPEYGSALTESIRVGEVQIVKKLLQCGADVNIPARGSDNPLVTAISLGDMELFRLLINDYHAEINPPTQDDAPETPLQATVSRGRLQMCHELINNGADIHSSGTGRSLLTQLCLVRHVGQMELVQRLLALGVDLEADDTKEIMVRPLGYYDLHSQYRLNPLQAAVYSNNQDLVKLLLDKDAMINPKPTRGTFGNPLQVAVVAQYTAMVKFLLDRGANVNAVGGKLGTALNGAVGRDSKRSIVTMLLDAGADVSLEAELYGSPLQTSALFGSMWQVRLFLDRGAPVNTSVGQHGNPLAAAASMGHVSIVDVLITHGSDPNQKGGRYGTPLQAACVGSYGTQTASEEIVELLLRNGAEVNPSVCGEFGTPLQAAACSKSTTIVELLLKHGADPNVRGGKYGSPLKAACSPETPATYRTEKLLLDHGAIPDA